MPWRGPDHADDFPSLGWELLDWWAEFLPSPRDPAKPLIFTDEQARQLVEWYRIDANGKRVYRRGYSRRSKGWGKSPVEAAKAIAEFAGPVRFGGWDAHGEPVGMPWGVQDGPRAWVQIGAISEDQTDNTWSVVHYLLTENDGRAAAELGIDAGLTRCFLPGQPGAKLEPVTSAAGSREGQPITYGVIDESHLMLPSNGGVKLARTIRRNVAKMGGTSYETTNSYIIGADSVAETSHEAVQAGSPGIFADEIQAPTEIDGVAVNQSAPDEILRRALDVAYGDSWWVDRPRLVEDMRDPANTWEDSARFFLNWPQTVAGDGAIANWLNLVDDASTIASNRQWALTVSPDRKHSSIGLAGRRADGRLHVEFMEHFTGTADVTDAVVTGWQATHLPIRIHRPGPEGSFIDPLRALGVEVIEVSSAEAAQAAGQLIDACAAGQLAHIGQSALTKAVEGAVLRTSSDGAALWSQRQSSVEITPLVAVTVALGGVPAEKAPLVFAY